MPGKVYGPTRPPSKPWTKQEDALIYEAWLTKNKNRTLVAATVPHRSLYAVRQRLTYLTRDIAIGAKKDPRLPK